MQGLCECPAARDHHLACLVCSLSVIPRMVKLLSNQSCLLRARHMRMTHRTVQLAVRKLSRTPPARSLSGCEMSSLLCTAQSLARPSCPESAIWCYGGLPAVSRKPPQYISETDCSTLKTTLHLHYNRFSMTYRTLRCMASLAVLVALGCAAVGAQRTLGATSTGLSEVYSRLNINAGEKGHCLSACLSSLLFSLIG
jgi:hypothetical protein